MPGIDKGTTVPYVVEIWEARSLLVPGAAWSPEERERAVKGGATPDPDRAGIYRLGGNFLLWSLMTTGTAREAREHGERLARGIREVWTPDGCPVVSVRVRGAR